MFSIISTSRCAPSNFIVISGQLHVLFPTALLCSTDSHSIHSDFSPLVFSCLPSIFLFLLFALVLNKVFFKVFGFVVCFLYMIAKTTHYKCFPIETLSCIFSPLAICFFLLFFSLFVLTIFWQMLFWFCCDDSFSIQVCFSRPFISKLFKHEKLYNHLSSGS